MSCISWQQVSAEGRATCVFNIDGEEGEEEEKEEEKEEEGAPVRPCVMMRPGGGRNESIPHFSVWLFLSYSGRADWL